MSRFLLLYRAEAATADGLRHDVAPIASALGLDPYVARLRLLGTGVQTLLVDPERERLEAKAEALRALGLQVTVYDARAERTARPTRARGFVSDGAGVRFTGLSGAPEGRIGLDDRLLVVPVGIRSPHELLRGRPEPEAFGPDSRVDLLTESGSWYSLHPTGFHYGGLGPELTHSVALNLRRVLAHLERVSGGVQFHVGCPANFGRPMEADDRAFYPLRVWTLWRAGGLGGPEPAASGDPAHFDVLLAQGGEDLAVLRAVPLRRRTLGWRARVPALLSPGNLWYGLWAAMLATAILGRLGPTIRALPLQAMFGGLLLGVSAFSVLHGIRQLRTSRRVADTPTARVRSVALGPAEVSGTVVADGGLTTPYTRLPCAWYEMRMERWSPGGARTRRFGGLFRTLLTWSSSSSIDEGGGWDLLYEGDSGDRPFFVDDGTGRLQVDPAGASMLLRHVETHEVRANGLPHRVTERVLPLGAAVYVLGQVRRDEGPGPDRDVAVVEAVRRLKQDPQALERFDADGDGRIDAGEWEVARAETRAAVEARLAAREREDTVCIGRGPPGDPFLVSDRDEVELARRLRWFARLGLVVGILAAVYGAQLLLGG